MSDSSFSAVIAGCALSWLSTFCSRKKSTVCKNAVSIAPKVHSAQQHPTSLTANVEHCCGDVTNRRPVPLQAGYELASSSLKHFGTHQLNAGSWLSPFCKCPGHWNSSVLNAESSLRLLVCTGTITHCKRGLCAPRQSRSVNNALASLVRVQVDGARGIKMKLRLYRPE